jgi:hypothetical protein
MIFGFTPAAITYLKNKVIRGRPGKALNIVKLFVSS